MLTALFSFSSCTSSLPESHKMKPGTYQQKVDIRFRAFRRTYRIHIPDSFDRSRAYPLLIALHGAFSNAAEFEEVTGFSELGDEEGLIVAYPNGVGILGYLQHWNGGHCCGMAADKEIDDAGFVRSVIRDIKNRLPIDGNRIYMVGFSNGGMLTYRFAAEYPDEITAIAGISTTIGSIDPQRSWDWILPEPDTPVPVFIAHGLDDGSIPYQGGGFKGGDTSLEFFSVDQSTLFWIKANDCPDPPLHDTDREGYLSRDIWRDSSGHSMVSLYAIKGWDHRWPAPFHTLNLPHGHPLRGFDVTREIWDFLRTKRRDLSP